MWFYDVRLIRIIGAYNNNNNNNNNNYYYYYYYYNYCYMLHLCVMVLELSGRKEKVQTVNDSKCSIPL
jgi:hypothetical protein